MLLGDWEAAHEGMAEEAEPQPHATPTQMHGTLLARLLGPGASCRPSFAVRIRT